MMVCAEHTYNLHYTGFYFIKVAEDWGAVKPLQKCSSGSSLPGQQTSAFKTLSTKEVSKSQSGSKIFQVVFFSLCDEH
jgi:hypothetical protein